MCSLWLQACSTEKNGSIQEETAELKNKTTPSPEKKWDGTTLSTATIQKIQQNKYTYKQCIYKEAQKQGYRKIDARVATDAVIKQCEAELSTIRTIFKNEGVPDIIIDRFLKKTRVSLTRQILKSLMFAQAARQAGATQ